MRSIRSSLQRLEQTGNAPNPVQSLDMAITSTLTLARGAAWASGINSAWDVLHTFGRIPAGAERHD